jgi:hypothetical protein
MKQNHTSNLLLTCPLFVAALLFPLTSLAQDSTVEKEGAYWIAATAKKKISKDFRASLTPEMRSTGWEPSEGLLTFDVRYKPIDYFAAEVGYRASFEDDSGDLQRVGRINLDLIGFLPLGDFEAGARFRYTNSFGPLIASEQTLRYKGSLEYEIKKVDVSFDGLVEAFQNLDPAEFSKIRYGLGVTWEFYKTKKVDQSIRVGYHLDYFLTKYKNINVAEFSYGVDF